jgi:Ca2+-binding EF-hand superfamily protein
VYELLQLLGMKNVRLEDVRQMIAETDKDGSGSVDFQEFLQARTHAQQFAVSDEHYPIISPEAIADGMPTG